MRTPMPKSTPPENNRRRKPEAEVRPRPPGAASLLFLWPFHLFNLFTRWPGLIPKLLIRAVGYPLVAGLYVMLFFAAVYGIRAQRYDLMSIHAMPQRSIIRDRMGEEIGRIHGEKRSVVPLRQVSESFRSELLGVV